MNLQVAIGSDVSVSFDDEITEVVDDYLARLRQHALIAYLALPSLDEADASSTIEHD
jgi:hypothetical protein